MPHLLQVRNAARDNVDAQRTSVVLTEDRFRTGLASKLDVTQAGSLLATTEAEIPTLETGARRISA